MYDDNYGDEPNYIVMDPTKVVPTNVSSLGPTRQALRLVSTSTDDDLTKQPREFWKYLGTATSAGTPVQLPTAQEESFTTIPLSDAQRNFVYNVASDLYGAMEPKDKDSPEMRSKDKEKTVWEIAFSK